MKITPNKLLSFPVKILEIERIRNSTSGNPRFSIIWDDELGWAGEAKTAADSAFNYEIGNPGFREGDWVYLAFSARHNITDIRPQQETN